jgi:hypothetical protein
VSVSEGQRMELSRWLEDRMGTDRAASLMAMLPPSGWSEVATKQDLAELEQRQSLRFDAIDQRFDAIDQRFSGIDQRFVSIDQRFVSIDQRFESMDRSLDQIHQAIRSQTDRYISWILASHGFLLSAAAIFAALT